MAFEIIMLMAAVTGECGCFQLIPYNLFFFFLPPFSTLPFFSGSVFGKIQSFVLFNLVADAWRLGH